MLRLKTLKNRPKNGKNEGEEGRFLDHTNAQIKRKKPLIYPEELSPKLALPS